jgi:hypothetical protein
MIAKPLPSLQRLRDVLAYDAATGVFTWIAPASNAVTAGDTAGGVNAKGYVHISIDGDRFKASRLAWLYMTGEDPGEMEVDHENRVRDDNRFANLRLATRKQNNENINPPRCNTSGARGVSFYVRQQKWEAYIYSNKRRRHIGYFKDKADAIRARAEAESKHFTFCAGIVTKEST